MLLIKIKSDIIIITILYTKVQISKQNFRMLVPSSLFTLAVESSSKIAA